MEDFDDTWIKDFEESQSLKVIFLYINDKKELYKVTEEIVEIKNKILTKNQAIELILKNKKKHKLTGILSYIVNNNNYEFNDYKSFFLSLRLQDIHLDKSPKIFESINTVFLVFEEDCKKLKQNTTKKVFVHSSRKTRRKALKANSS